MIQKSQKIKILAIETSCDETAAAVAEGQIIDNRQLKVDIQTNIVASQIKLHQKYGGVWPEMASRAHIEKIIPVISTATSSQQPVVGNQQSAIGNKERERLADIDAIAMTKGPGLIGSLLVGVNTAKTLAYALKKPLIPINHLEGHIYANFIGNLKTKNEKVKTTTKNLKVPEFPLVALTVSGGHTALVLMKKHLDYQILGETLDDAAGEAFDKVARLLDLGYPGGPQIEREAARFEIKNQKSKVKMTMQNAKFKLPRPMINSDNFNFSFSGLKTAVLRIVKEKKFNKTALAWEFQEAVTDVLTAKTLKAAQKFQAKSVLLGGGVATNQRLRQKLSSQIQKYTDAQVFIPPLSLCTDNAAMIAAAAVFHFFLEKGVKNWYNIKIDANFKLT